MATITNITICDGGNHLGADVALSTDGRQDHPVRIALTITPQADARRSATERAASDHLTRILRENPDLARPERREGTTREESIAYVQSQVESLVREKAGLPKAEIISSLEHHTFLE